MKNRIPLLSTILLFFIVNTQYFWERPWSFFVILILLLFFIVLFITLLVQLVFIIRGKFRETNKIVNTSVMACLLFLIAYRPTGIIDFEKFQGKDIFIASRRGVANCETVIKLKTSGRFFLKSVCFGIEKENGFYSRNNDTIKFVYQESVHNALHFRYGIIKKDSFGGKEHESLVLYDMEHDSTRMKMEVSLNDFQWHT